VFDSFLERGIQTALTQKRIYTEEDYYNSPEDVRIELIDGQIYYQAAPNRMHQTILGELYTVINNYIKPEKGTCLRIKAALVLQTGLSKLFHQEILVMISSSN